MSAITPTQADHLLELVNRATGRRYRKLSQVARQFGMSGGAVVRMTGAQAEVLIEEWSARPEYIEPWSPEAVNAGEAGFAGEGAMTVEQAASALGCELFVTTPTSPDGMTLVPNAVELLGDGRPALTVRIPLADVTSWSKS